MVMRPVQVVCITLLLSFCYSFTNFHRDNSRAKTSSFHFSKDIIVDIDDIDSIFDIESSTKADSGKDVDVISRKAITIQNQEKPMEEDFLNSFSVIRYDEKPENDYDVDFTSILSQEESRQVMSSISMEEAESISDVSLSSIPPRGVIYDPAATNRFRNDPMNYGAYRRWKLAEQDVDKLKKSKSKPGSKGKNKGSADSFFDSIKKLGSGPVPKGTVPGVGFAEPSGNMSPIQPQKAPSRKRKKIITPDDIDSLFESKTSETATVSSQSGGNSALTTPDSSENSGFSFLIPPEEKADWVREAEKELNKKQVKAKKKKPLTEDWRFWAGLVTLAGFASAAYSVIQKTGGLSPQELII